MTQDTNTASGAADLSLQKRVIFDAIRSAYDLGYSDARNARSTPGDSAPGYKGRQVEADHGGALSARIAALASAQAQPVAAPAAQPAPAAQQEAQEPCPTCAALARTVMLDQVSFDRKPDCYGIRQITDDEGVEEWEDIRTSPDVAREEANDMMATGRGEIYEVVPLWTTPQPSPTAQAKPDAGVLEDAARYRHIRDVPHSEEVRSVLSLQQNAVMDKVIDKDRAAMAAKRGGQHD